MALYIRAGILGGGVVLQRVGSDRGQRGCLRGEVTVNERASELGS